MLEPAKFLAGNLLLLDPACENFLPVYWSIFIYGLSGSTSQSIVHHMDMDAPPFLQGWAMVLLVNRSNCCNSRFPNSPVSGRDMMVATMETMVSLQQTEDDGLSRGHSMDCPLLSVGDTSNGALEALLNNFRWQNAGVDHKMHIVVDCADCQDYYMTSIVEGGRSRTSHLLDLALHADLTNSANAALSGLWV